MGSDSTTSSRSLRSVSSKFCSRTASLGIYPTGRDIWNLIWLVLIYRSKLMRKLFCNQNIMPWLSLAVFHDLANLWNSLFHSANYFVMYCSTMKLSNRNSFAVNELLTMPLCWMGPTRITCLQLKVSPVILSRQYRSFTIKLRFDSGISRDDWIRFLISHHDMQSLPELLQICPVLYSSAGISVGCRPFQFRSAEFTVVLCHYSLCI